jgi:hypothetical protein
VEVTGTTTFHRAQFVVEDDNCFSFEEGGMYIEFDGPAAFVLGGTTTPGPAANVHVELWTGQSEEQVVAYSTDLVENRGTCEITIDESSSVRTTGSFRCTGMAGARFVEGSGLVKLSGNQAATIDLSGRFELNPIS